MFNYLSHRSYSESDECSSEYKRGVFSQTLIRVLSEKLQKFVTIAGLVPKEWYELQVALYNGDVDKWFKMIALRLIKGERKTVVKTIDSRPVENMELADISPELISLVREYRRLSYLPKLSEEEAERISWILSLAEIHDELNHWINKVDSELAVELDFFTENTDINQEVYSKFQEVFENQNLDKKSEVYSKIQEVFEEQ